MNISILSGINPVTVKKSNNQIPTRRIQGIQSDTFVKSAAVKENEQKQAFDVSNALDELSQQKSFNGKPKFNEEKLNVLGEILKENPKKWNDIKTISSQPKMISSLVLEFASKDIKTLDAITELSLKEDEKGAKKFSPLEIEKLVSKLDGDGLKVVGQLSDTPLESNNIIKIAKDKNIKDINKLRNKVNKFSESAKDVRRVSFSKDEYDENAYNIRIDMNDNGSKILLLDKDLNETAIEIVEIEKKGFDKVFQIKKSKDFRHNTVSQITSEINPKKPLPAVTSEIRVVKDKSGNLIRREEYQLSDIEGTPNIKYIYPDGSEKIISSASTDEKTGITSVFKNMESLDGTRTEYSFEDDKSGNMISDYKITDKNGKVIFNHSMTFEVVSENKFISTENDKYYEITVEKNNISIKNMQNDEITSLSFDKMNGNREKLLNSLKRMPAEELIELGKNTTELVGIDNLFQSTYAAKTKTINSGDNLFTILHEAGHAKDYANVDVKQKETLANSIYSNPEVNKVFEEEKAAFNKAFPLAQRDHISYFIKNSEHKDGLQETVAEANALINTRNTEDLFTFRSHYLQQYFPRTIAILATIID